MRAAAGLPAEDSFEEIAREWYGLNAKTWAPSHASKILGRFERDVFPWIGKRPITAITPTEVLTVLKRVEARGALESAHRIHQICGQVFRFAIASGRAGADPTRDLRGALAPWRPEHYATITEPREVGQLLRDIDAYEGGLMTRCALRLAPLVFVRPGELRQAEWAEIDLDLAEWRIPAKKMKARRMHIVPLSTQAVATLHELQPLTGGGQWVFPSLRSNGEPMSENTINAALRRMGYERSRMTAHGFRGMASTLLHEAGFPTQIIERQLAHVERDEVKAAYNHAEHLPARRKMMQSWADHLDALRRSKSAGPVPDRPGPTQRTHRTGAPPDLVNTTSPERRT